MRLIDADEFMKTVLRMKRLNEECPLSDIYLENEKINNYETGQRETFDLITEQLDAQPTAYDPEKVVSELDKLADKANDKILEAGELQLYYDGYEDGMRTAVEVVKGGGVDAF